MGTIFFLILFPLIVAVALLVLKTDAIRGIVVIASSIIIGAAAIFFVVQNFDDGGTYIEVNEKLAEILGYGMMLIECALAIIIIVLGIKYRKYLASLLAAIQAPAMVWFELTSGHDLHVVNALYIDRLSMIMALIIGIIGSMICVYALGYMKDFVHHHHDQPDRRPWFFFLMFLFLSAMFGIVVSNNIVWLYFFWEITTLCSFFLIGYTKTPEAIRNSFRQLIMNLLGGLAFVFAIVAMGKNLQTLELDQLITMGQYGFDVMLPVVLLAFAGITKAAQMPFNSWLLGAMVAPTPTSALLHSSTMVKAGVFLIVKLAPVLGGNIAGFMVMMVGGITFLMASMAAVSQSNAKRVLAYSTVANLGLIVACAGVGNPGAVWAAIMLIIFHAVTKSLLFLCVGTAEHNIGSRDIEDMDGLFDRMPKLATLMIIGIVAMFLAPFGMLISKWAGLQSVIYSGNIFLVLFVIFGSSITIFYWGKWLGKMTAVVAGCDNIENQVHKEEKGILGGLTALVVIVSLTFPAISKYMVVPYLESANPMYQLNQIASMLLSNTDMIIMVIMVAVILALSLIFFGRTKKKIVPVYMAGAGMGDNLTYMGSMQKETRISLRNWYMEGYFGEKRMNLVGIIGTCIIIGITFAYAIVMGGLM